MDKVEKAAKWYASNLKLYEELSKKVESLIKDIIKSKGISYLDVTSRAKTIDSFLDKAKKDKYSEPESEIKDLAGIRVIAYVESDVNKICNLIEKEFAIDPDNSVNKSEILKVNEVGYRSVHYVARFSDSRLGLLEFQRFANIYFEIQVRTILQHAWAEIEHDRNYKLSGVLPEINEIQRRFSLLSGLLEVSDREFDSLVRDIDKYAVNVAESTKSGNLEISLDSISLREYLNTRYEQEGLDLSALTYNDDKSAKSIIKELNNFGIHNLQDLDRILSKDLIRKILKVVPKTTIVGLMRTVMIVTNADKYFEKSWGKNFHLNNSVFVNIASSFNIPIEYLKEKYGV